MDQYFGLVRYDADGTVDTTFGGDRRVITNFTSGDDDVSDVAIQADGKIVAVGRSGDEGPGSLTKFARRRRPPRSPAARKCSSTRLRAK